MHGFTTDPENNFEQKTIKVNLHHRQIRRHQNHHQRNHRANRSHVVLKAHIHLICSLNPTLC